MREAFTKAMLKIVKARTSLLISNPFFGSLALRLKMIECTEDHPMYPSTMRTNGKVIEFHTKFVEDLDPEEIKAVIAHEILHVGLMHTTRMGSRDFWKWQHACDYAVNSILNKCKFKLPNSALLNSAYDDMSAEKIYALLPDMKGDNHSSVEWGIVCPTPASDNPDQSIGNGQPQQPLSAADQKKVEQEIKDAIVATMKTIDTKKSCGVIPGFAKEMIEALSKPKISYRELLRDFLEAVAKNDYSFKTPNVRYSEVTKSTGLILPGMQSQEIGNIAFIIDSSGSISDEEKKRYASEISGVLEDFPLFEIDVIYVDTKVQNVQHLTAEDLPLSLEFSGGGGTSFVPGFDYIKENDIDPKCALYFTDGECSRFPDPPDYPVIWLCTSGVESLKNAPFGEVIGLEVD